MNTIKYNFNKKVKLRDMEFTVDYTINYTPAFFAEGGRQEYPEEYDIEINDVYVSNDGKNKVDISWMISEFVDFYEFLSDELMKTAQQDIVDDDAFIPRNNRIMFRGFA